MSNEVTQTPEDIAHAEWKQKRLDKFLRRKKRLAVVGPICIVLALAMVGTGAYFTATYDEWGIPPYIGLILVGVFLFFISIILTVVGKAAIPPVRYMNAEQVKQYYGSNAIVVNGVLTTTQAAAVANQNLALNNILAVATGQMPQIKCPYCQADNDADALFCTTCGYVIAKKCPKCWNMEEREATFCSKCGQYLE